MSCVQKIKYGRALGKLTIAAALQVKAQAVAKAFWKDQVADEFMENVDTWKPTVKSSLDWLPTDELAELGFRPIKKNSHWVMTTGVDAHVDNIWGPTLVWVLVNDGMYFKQGRERFVHQPGEWYIFSDSAKHEVGETKSSFAEAVYLGWAVGLERV